MALGSTIATGAGLMKTSPSAAWRLNRTKFIGLPALAPCAASRPGRLSPSSSSAAVLDVGDDESCAHLVRPPFNARRIRRTKP